MSSGHHERGFLHTLTTVEGLLRSFRHGLHGTVSPPQETVVVFGCIEGSFLVSRTGCVRESHAPCIEGPFLVSRTGHVRERHSPYMGHETVNWRGRGLGYMLFNSHLCNQPYYVQSGGGSWGTVLYTVRGVGSESRSGT
jgi:hypothetical protein